MRNFYSVIKHLDSHLKRAFGVEIEVLGEKGVVAPKHLAEVVGVGLEDVLVDAHTGSR